MTAPVRTVRVSVEDYLAGERVAVLRHECVDGELFAMTGASRSHNAVTDNLPRLLATHLRSGPCRLAASDMKVRPAIATRFYYPDGTPMAAAADPQGVPLRRSEKRYRATTGRRPGLAEFRTGTLTTRRHDGAGWRFRAIVIGRGRLRSPRH